MMAVTTAPASAAPTTDYEVVIGLEVHAQLLTASKMFCTCDAQYADAPPNTLVCPVCLGLPGTLPVINEQAVEYTVRTALALNCDIPEYTKFDRKNYNYPDLMKGYQISQYDLPLSQHGWLDIETDSGATRIGITRVHLEEDVAKLYHRRDDLGETYSLMDVNRSGVPLMEIVGEPDLRSPEDAGRFLQTLRLLLRHLGVSTANMEDGAFRCDANISLRPRGSDEFGAKVEVKNMNSFRAVQRALAYESERQAAALTAGERIEQETRGWVEERGVTVSQRSKEQAHDYRYFPEPDLPPLELSREWVEQVRTQLPELPAARQRRFVEQYALSPADAGLLLDQPVARRLLRAGRRSRRPGARAADCQLAPPRRGAARRRRRCRRREQVHARPSRRSGQAGGSRYDLRPQRARGARVVVRNRAATGADRRAARSVPGERHRCVGGDC